MGAKPRAVPPHCVRHGDPQQERADARAKQIEPALFAQQWRGHDSSAPAGNDLDKPNHSAVPHRPENMNKRSQSGVRKKWCEKRVDRIGIDLEHASSTMPRKA